MCLRGYFEFIVIIIFKDKRGRACFVNQVELVLVGNWQHLSDELGRFVSPWNRTGHLTLYNYILQTIIDFYEGGIYVNSDQFNF